LTAPPLCMLHPIFIATRTKTWPSLQLHAALTAHAARHDARPIWTHDASTHTRHAAITHTSTNSCMDLLLYGSTNTCN
jgi:hypothetical protein